MKDIPIIFSAPMILALDREATEHGAGKTMTRRMAWGKPVGIDIDEEAARDMRRDGWKVSGPDDTEHRIAWRATPWQRVQAGDRLWVRESLAYKLGMWWYAADDTRVALEPQHAAAGTAWAHHYPRDSAPSIHMPRAISRFTLVVTGTKVERLQAITDVECEREGVERLPDDNFGSMVWKNYEQPDGFAVRLGGRPLDSFASLWRSLHGCEAWTKNPEVVALTFTVHKQNIDSLKQAA